MAFSHQGQAIQLSVTPYEAAKVKERLALPKGQGWDESDRQSLSLWWAWAWWAWLVSEVGKSGSG